MKYLIIFILSIQSVMACQLSIPESYVPTFLNPPVQGHYQKCEDKPEDKCICVEKADPWTSELQDELTNGEPIYSDKANILACESEEACELLRMGHCKELPDYSFFYSFTTNDGFEAYCTKLLGYEQVKTGNKILVENAQKKAAYLANIEAKKQAEEDKKLQKTELMGKLKAVKKSDLTSNAKTVEVLMGVLELLKE